MRGHSHLLIGASVGAILAAHSGAEPIGIAAAAFSALVPDIDHPYSMLGRFIPQLLWPGTTTAPNRYGFSKVGRHFPFSRKVVWHRGQCHSLGFGLLVTTLFSLAYFLLSQHYQFPGLLESNYLLLFAVSFFAGFLSHLLADSFNISKMMWLWPLSHQESRLSFIPHASQKSARGQFYELSVVLACLLIALYITGLLSQILTTSHIHL